MDSFDKTLRGRKSVRSYSDAVPDEDTVRSIIDASLYYPSPSGSHNARFVRIGSSDARTFIREHMTNKRDSMLSVIGNSKNSKRLRNYINAYWRYSEFMFNSPVLISVEQQIPESTFTGALLRAGLVSSDESEMNNFFMAIGASIMAFQLKAHSMGLGSCILTAPLNFMDRSVILSELGIDPECFLTLGYPSDSEITLRENYNTESFYREI